MVSDEKFVAQNLGSADHSNTVVRSKARKLETDHGATHKRCLQ